MATKRSKTKTDERQQELKAGKAKLIEEATEYGINEAQRYCETASYEDMAVIADLEPDTNGRYQFPEGEELDLEGFTSRVHRTIEKAYVKEVRTYLNHFDKMTQ